MLSAGTETARKPNVQFWLSKTIEKLFAGLCRTSFSEGIDRMGGNMAMTIVAVTELSGGSEESWSDAVGQVVMEAMRLLQPIVNADSDKAVANGILTRLDEYRATVSVAFIVDVRGPKGMLISTPVAFDQFVSVR